MEETLLMQRLLEASVKSKNDLLFPFLKAISSSIPCKLCSVWKIKHQAGYVSVYSRDKYSPTTITQDDFVHPIKNSLIGLILEELENSKAIYSDIKDVSKSPYWEAHASKHRVNSLKLKRLISIPIPRSDNLQDKAQLDAILNIYAKDDVKFSNTLALLIREQLSLALSRSRLLRREELTREVIKIYEKKARKDLSSVFHPIITTILPKYFKYEGCSIFIWDPFFNRLALSQTTGLKEKISKSEIFYYLGEGLTGKIAELRKPKIIDDLSTITDKNLIGEYIHKFQEETNNIGKSFMAIPIMSPSRPGELIGVIRFTNRLNPLAPVVDYFSSEDLDLVNHACILIALYMEYEQSEIVRSSFAKQLAHEMFTPAFAIKGSSNRLIKKVDDPNFSDYQRKSILINIRDHSQLQMALIRSINYVRKGEPDVPKKHIYTIKNCDFKRDIILQSKKLVIPFARIQKVKFDDISHTGDFPELFVDKFAFIQVFFNLITNAIKYRQKSSPETFRIEIRGYKHGNYIVPGEFDFNANEALIQSPVETRSGYLITVSDNGIGISFDELSKIYLFGYRTKGIEKVDVRGLGLGLTVVKKIIDDFNCKVWVSNNINPTIFKIFLPDELSSRQYVNKDNWI